MDNSKYFLEACKIVPSVAPSADVYNGNPGGEVIDMTNYERCTFLLYQKTSTSNTGKATITVEKCDDATPSKSTAIAFNYRKNESAGTADTLGDLTAATASGFSTTANKTALYAVEVRADQLDAAKPYVRMVCTEATNDPVIGCVIAVLSGAKKQGATLPTGLAA